MGIFDTIWRRKGRPPQNQPEIEEDPILHITMTDRDYSALLERGYVAVKFWLPELMGEMLDQQCSFSNTTRSDLIRQNLFMYLYGRHDLWGLIEQRNHNYTLDAAPKFSRRQIEPDDEVREAPPIMKDLGKNTEDLKVWIPRKMKEDIQSLADKASLSLSEMIREIIISMLIGHTYLAARKDLLQIEIEVEEDSHE